MEVKMNIKNLIVFSILVFGILFVSVNTEIQAQIKKFLKDRYGPVEKFLSNYKDELTNYSSLKWELTKKYDLPKQEQVLERYELKVSSSSSFNMTIGYLKPKEKEKEHGKEVVFFFLFGKEGAPPLSCSIFFRKEVIYYMATDYTRFDAHWLLELIKQMKNCGVFHFIKGLPYDVLKEIKEIVSLGK